MYSRSLTVPNHTFFLFGPRGTGKTTWLRDNFASATWVNLLTNQDFLPLLNNPGLLAERVLAKNEGWVVIDEVQKIPGLLNEVHNLISIHNQRYKFAMSGSSARKLRRMEANLLAGRALDRKFFPLAYPEIKAEFNLERILRVGTLPSVFASEEYSSDLLESYVSTYLREEIQQEALVKNLESFARFLKVAGILNGSVIDHTHVARECSVNRKSVERYFDTLVDTLVAFRLPAFQPRLKVKERVRPKFYLFDCGVVRTLTGRTRQEVLEFERGNLLETYLMHEFRTAQSYLNTGGEMSYYGTERSEVDLILSVGGESIGFEFKASERWRTESNKTLEALLEHSKIKRAFGIYLGAHRLQSGNVTVLPVVEALELLWQGKFSA